MDTRIWGVTYSLDKMTLSLLAYRQPVTPPPCPISAHFCSSSKQYFISNPWSVSKNSSPKWLVKVTQDKHFEIFQNHNMFEKVINNFDFFHQYAPITPMWEPFVCTLTTTTLYRINWIFCEPNSEFLVHFLVICAFYNFKR